MGFNRFLVNRRSFPQPGADSGAARGAFRARTRAALLLALAMAVAPRAGAAELNIRMSLVSVQGVGAGIGIVRLADSKGALSLTPLLERLSPGLHALAWRPTGDCAPARIGKQEVAAGASRALPDPDRDKAAAAIAHATLPPLAVDPDGIARKSVTARGTTLAELEGRALVIFAHGVAGDDRDVIACGVVP